MAKFHRCRALTHHQKAKTMFTIDKIKEAHSTVKSGADFPKYVKELIQLGVESYESFVADGHILFHGDNGFSLRSGAKYPILTIADQSAKTQFEKVLKAHQRGQSDYPSFCRESARSGIEKWVVDMSNMTCTYYDKKGGVVLTESIPQPLN